MITHRSKFAPFPLTIKISFKKRDWYLFPQGWAWVGGFAEVSYQHSYGEFDVWKEVHYPTYKGYAFSWLFLHIVFDIRKGKGNEMLVQKKELRIPDISKEMLGGVSWEDAKNLVISERNKVLDEAIKYLDENCDGTVVKDLKKYLESLKVDL